jgi:hypothetical protein
MGNVNPPTASSEGSGDQFGTVTAGTPAARKEKKKLLRYSDFNLK